MLGPFQVVPKRNAIRMSRRPDMPLQRAFAFIVAVLALTAGRSALAQACGGEGARNCFAIHATPGCSDGTCCSHVCAFDSFCCEVEWDYICRHSAVELCNPPVPANDTVAGARNIPAADFEVCTIGATDSETTRLPDGCGGMFGSDIRKDVWFRFRASVTGTAILTSCPAASKVVYSEFDPIILVRDAAGEPLACNDELAGCGSYAAVEWAVEAGSSYLIQIGGHDIYVGYGRFLLAEEGTPPPPNCPADLDGDGLVGAFDMAVVLDGWGTATGDIDGDGRTDARDISALLDGWGACP
ncbi:MAG: hypothetical protein RLZZ238_1143 [Planctomycetota bacterium]